MFWFFGCQACGILGPELGIELTLPALEGELLAPGLPEKTLPVCPIHLPPAHSSWHEQHCENASWILKHSTEVCLVISFLLKIFLLQDICVTILCWFLPHVNMNQPQIYVCPLAPEPPSHLPPHPSPPGCHRALG